MGVTCTKAKKQKGTDKSLNQSADPKLIQQQADNSFYELHDGYILHSMIGAGFFGIVMFGKFEFKGGDSALAVKRIRKEQIRNELKDFQQEIKQLIKVDHPIIVKIIECLEFSQSFYLVTQYCSGGQLFERISQQDTFSEQQASNIMFKLFQAINCLHQQNIYHGDLKPENILYSKPDCPESEIKIVNFGLGRKFGNAQMGYFLDSDLFASSQSQINQQGKANDIQSLGIIMHFLLCGYPPSWDEGVCSLEGEDWSQISEQAKDFIRRATIKNPSERLTAQDALNHLWFKQKCDYRDMPLNPIVLQRLRRYSASQTLKQATIAILSQYLTVMELNELSQVIRDGDIENLGCVSYQWLSIYLQRLEISPQLYQFQQMILNVIIAGDDFINYNELITIARNFKRQYNEEKIKAIFKELDFQNVGKIRAENLEQVLRSIGVIKTQQEVDEILRRVGKEGEKFIHFHEFQRIIDQEENLAT